MSEAQRVDIGAIPHLVRAKSEFSDGLGGVNSCRIVRKSFKRHSSHTANTVFLMCKAFMVSLLSV